MSVDVPNRSAEDTRGDSCERDEADQQAEPRRELEEARSTRRVRGVTALDLGQRPGTRAEGLAVLCFVRNRHEGDDAVGRHQQRFGGCAEDTVAPLQLGAVHGEIGLVDE